MSDPFILGVNYWPRRKAMYWWSDFDAREVREEFAVIASLGMTIVRIFLLWDDFQPTPDSVSSACIQNLTTVCDIAAENNLRIDLTFFTGHMSGPNWSPRWLLDANAGIPSTYNKIQVISGGEVVSGGYRNPYHDVTALDAQRLLLRTVVGHLKNHPGVWMWNLGNEPDLFAQPHSAEAGRSWVREMTARINGQDGSRPVTCGLHVDSLGNNNGFRTDYVYGEVDIPVMHAYPMYASWAQHPLDPNVVPYTCALTTALCGKPTLMEEWGGCTAQPGEASYVWEWVAYGLPRTQFMASEEDLAAYVEAVLPKLVEVGATGAMMWCYADYAEELWDKPPCSESRHERFFGLVRPNGTLKPHAEVIKRFAATRPMVNPNPPRRVQLDITPDEYYADPSGHLRRLYEAYLAQYESA